jgi:hypothetical protein
MANKSNIINPTMRTTACCAEAGLTACCAGGCPRGGCPRSVSNRNLRLYQYDLKTLEENIATLCVKTIVNTQILTAEFCAKYILDEAQMTCVEDTYLITLGYVLYKQPHLKEEDILAALPD